MYIIYQIETYPIWFVWNCLVSSTSIMSSSIIEILITAGLFLPTQNVDKDQEYLCVDVFLASPS